MTRRNRWRRIGALFDIPEDVTNDASRITIVGRAELAVENHGGVVEYSEDLLRVRIGEGELRIRGDSLILTMIAADELRVAGYIRAVQYV